MPDQKELATMDGSAARAVGPIAIGRQVLELAPNLLQHAAPIFYGDVRQAAFQALGLN